MRLTNFKKELLSYFSKTPKEQIVKDWEKTAKYDKEGITATEFMEQMNK